jgi:hypothetical protein
VQDGVLHDQSLEDPKMEHFALDRDDLDLDRLLDHADTFSEPCLEDPSGKCFNQIENDMDLDNVLKQAMMVGLKGLLHTLNAIVSPTKTDLYFVFLIVFFILFC